MKFAVPYRSTGHVFDPVSGYGTGLRYFDNRQSGYTLLESLIALIIFVSFIVPLLSFLYQDRRFTHTRDIITARCLLEQETARIYSGATRPATQRTLGNATWRVEGTATGRPLTTWVLSATKNGRYVDKVRFMVHEPDK